jgi:hypothetical protein
MVSTTIALTNQFYEWEQLGRGWQIAVFNCDLEPPFEPFRGHFIPEDGIVDDGKRPSFWQTLFSPEITEKKQSKEEVDSAPAAYPYHGTSNELTIYTVTLPKHYKQRKERLCEFLVMLSYRKNHISFEIIACDESIVVQWAVQDTDAAFFYAQMRIFFPEIAIVETYGDCVLDLLTHAPCLYTIDFGLAEEFMRPIATLSNGDQDPFTALFGLFEQLNSTQVVIIQILFSGMYNNWAESILTAVTDDSGKGSFFFDAPEMPQLAKEKISAPLFAVTLRAVAISHSLEEAGVLLQHIATTIVHASQSASNALLPLGGEAYTVEMRLADIVFRETHRLGMLLNVNELATFAHFPGVFIQTNKVLGSSATTKAAPQTLTGHQYILGQNIHQGVLKEVSIDTAQRLKHVHILGATGTGKSTLLTALIMQDIEQGNGICVLDPHGDLIDTIISAIPEDRITDVVLIDPADSQFPVGFNILSAHSDIEKELLASDLVAIFKRFSTSWGDQMNSVFANAILAFVQNTKQYHLGDLRRFLIEAPFRNHILTTSTDPDIAYYWQHEFPILKSGSIGSILTRLDSFLRPKVIRNMVCQTKSIDFGAVMDSKKIVLVKLSQGLMGTENSYLLGAFIVSKLQQTALSRQLQQASTRTPFYVYIDEFHHFITPSMAAILSGARKFGVGLILAHQDIAQVQKYDAEVASSLLSNAGTRICFRLGDSDAKRLEDGFTTFSAADLQNLATGEAIARVNTADAAFNLSVIAFDSVGKQSFVQAIIEHSRSTYSVVIEEAPPAPVVAAPIQTKPSIPYIEPIVPLTSEKPTEVKEETVREHRYLQNFIKAMAETHGYKAQLEVPTPDGAGQVDVLLEKGANTIAVEISVTTTAEWELHNIKKCLTAGYNQIAICTTSVTKLNQIKSRLAAALSADVQKRIITITQHDIPSLFAADKKQPQTETLVKGYRVKVKYEPNAPRQDLLQTIINATKKM